MKICESIVNMVTSAALYRYGLHYRNDDVSFTRSKRVNKKLYFIILPVGRPVSMQNFRLNVSCFDIGTACIIVYSVFQEVKGLMEKLYAYALARVKTCLHAKF